MTPDWFYPLFYCPLVEEAFQKNKAPGENPPRVSRLNGMHNERRKNIRTIEWNDPRC